MIVGGIEGSRVYDMVMIHVHSTSINNMITFFYVIYKLQDTTTIRWGGCVWDVVLECTTWVTSCKQRGPPSEGLVQDPVPFRFSSWAESQTMSISFCLLLNHTVFPLSVFKHSKDYFFYVYLIFCHCDEKTPKNLLMIKQRRADMSVCIFNIMFFFCMQRPAWPGPRIYNQAIIYTLGCNVMAWYRPRPVYPRSSLECILASV